MTTIMQQLSKKQITQDPANSRCKCNNKKIDDNLLKAILIKKMSLHILTFAKLIVEISKKSRGINKAAEWDRNFFATEKLAKHRSTTVD